MTTGSISQKNNWYYCLALVVIIIAAFVRLYDLDHESLFMDEVYQVSFYQLPWSKLYIGASQQQQPPLDYWVGKLANMVSGSDYSVRFPSALFGLGSIIIILIILWRMASPVVGLIIASIYSLSPFHTYFSQEARPYSIAIFFILVLCATVSWLENEKELRIFHFIILVLVELLLLLSRSLSPLSVFIVLNVLFFLRLCVGIIRMKKEEIVRNTAYLCAAVVAFILYLPIFLNLMKTSARYTSHNGLLETVLKGIEHFTLMPGYEAFIVQLEPLGYLFLPIVFIGIILQLFRFKSFEKLDIFMLSAYLLVASMLFHLFVFIAKGNFPRMPFRPPYPVYLQPLSLLLTGFVVHVIYTKLNNKRIFVIFFVLVLFIMGFSTYQSKAIQHKTDWRGAANYVKNSLGPQNLVVFETLSIRDSWKPYGWGFQRYELGVPGYNITTILENPSDLSRIQFKPVFIFFYYRDYKLLPGSPYVFIPNSGGYPPITEDSIVSNDRVNVTHFTGLVVVELRNYTDESMKDMYDLIKEIIYQLPQNNTLIDMLLLASELEILCPSLKDKKFEPLQGVQYLSEPDDFPYIKKVMDINSRLQPVCR